MPQKTLGSIVGLLCTGTCLVQGKEFCFGVNNEQNRCEMGYCCGETKCCSYYYELNGKEFCFGVNNEQNRCEMGYCCGETECCTYYYELWWFWLVWTLIIMLSCCCAYRHRRVKMRLQQEQRQREISLMAYQGASSSFISPPPLNIRFWNDCKLPDYEEVVGHPPTPPPPYSEIPPETAPVLPASSQSQAALVLEASVEEAPPTEEPQPSGSSADQGATSTPTAARCRAEEDLKASLAAAEEEELVTRRRHVTGDSGIEVCVCTLDVDEGSGLEEESDEEQQVCQGAGTDCCAGRQQHNFRHKARTQEHAGHTPDTSTGDHLV